jgi:hypothetical protein
MTAMMPAAADRTKMCAGGGASRSATTSTTATARPNVCDTSSTVTVGRRLAEIPPRKSPLP